MQIDPRRQLALDDAARMVQTLVDIGVFLAGMIDIRKTLQFGDDAGDPVQALDAVTQQVAAVAQLLEHANAPMTLEQITACFTGKGKWKQRVPGIISTLIVLARAECCAEDCYRAI